MKDSTNDQRSAKEDRWIKDLQKGNKEGFESIYRSYYSRLSQFAYRYVKSKAIAEDLVHNVFHNVWKNRQKVKANGKLRAYLYTAVRNQSIKYLKRRQRQAYANMEDLTLLKSREVSPEEQVNGEEFKEAVEEAINKLPERRREVFLLSREDNLTYREIAEVLEISIKTVETQMSRSLKFLRQELAQFIPTENMYSN